MSLLWIKTKHKTNKKKGENVETQSPKSRIIQKDFAQNLLSRIFGLFDQRSSIQKTSIKGISLRMSRRWQASMTVEAALVLPLFLIFFLQIGSIMEMLRLYGKVEMALWETGREMCLYGTAIQKFGEDVSLPSDATGGSVLETIGDVALSYTYVKGRVESYLGNEYLESAPLQGGKNGLQYLGSKILQDDGKIELLVTYCAKPKWSLAGYTPFFLENHYVGRLWNGYDLSANKGYYLAENIAVYHCDRECTHLRLRVYQVPWQEMLKAVNERGRKYHACKKCISSEKAMEYVWLSPEGECYHGRRDCPGLKRTIREVTWEEASKYRPCSRCVKKGGVK